MGPPFLRSFFCTSSSSAGCCGAAPRASSPPASLRFLDLACGSAASAAGAAASVAGAGSSCASAERDLGAARMQRPPADTQQDVGFKTVSAAWGGGDQVRRTRLMLHSNDEAQREDCAPSVIDAFSGQCGQCARRGACLGCSASGRCSGCVHCWCTGRLSSCQRRLDSALVLGAGCVCEERVLRRARHLADAALPGRASRQVLLARGLRHALGRARVIEEAASSCAPRLGCALGVLLDLCHARVVALREAGHVSAFEAAQRWWRRQRRLRGSAHSLGTPPLWALQTTRRDQAPPQQGSGAHMDAVRVKDARAVDAREASAWALPQVLADLGLLDGIGTVGAVEPDHCERAKW